MVRYALRCRVNDGTCVSVCVYMHDVCMCVRAVYTHTDTHTHMHTCTHMRTCTHSHIHTHTHTHTHHVAQADRGDAVDGDLAGRVAAQVIFFFFFL